MNSLPSRHLSLPAMPTDIVSSIISHLPDDTSLPVLRSVAAWSRTSHASQKQLKSWMEMHANPDQALQRRLGAAIAHGEPLVKLWQVARPFVHAISPATTVFRINEQLAMLKLDPRCAALLVLGSNRDQLSAEQQTALRNYLLRQKVISADGKQLVPLDADEACNVAGLLTMNAADLILEGKCNAEGVAQVVMRALIELPLEARILGLNALLSIVTSVDQKLYIEALQSHMAAFLPERWDPAYMESARGMVLLAALRMLADKRHADTLAIARPVLHFLGQWLDHLPPELRHVSTIDRTEHHQQVLLVIQCMFWMVRNDKDAKRCYAEQFIGRGFITAREFAVLEQHAELTRPGANLCFDKLDRLSLQQSDEDGYQRPAVCALM